MSQTWAGSLVEMKANIVSGFALNYCINIAILPILWNPASPKLSAFYIGLVFTVVSCCRQLVIRRRMNKSKRFNVDMSAEQIAIYEARAKAFSENAAGLHRPHIKPITGPFV